MRIRYQLFWLRAFSALAGPGTRAGDRWEINDQLADAYFELAAAYRHLGLSEKSKSYERRALAHSLNGTPPEPRPAAALGMPVPQPYTRTEAIGTVPPEPPDQN